MTEPASDAAPEIDPSTPTSAVDGPTKAHGDPLLAASQGATEGTEGTRHGLGATDERADRPD